MREGRGAGWPLAGKGEDTKHSLWKMREQTCRAKDETYTLGTMYLKVNSKKWKERPVRMFECFSPNPVRS